ncbi:MAG TPA: VOC family protein [Longimicrobiales bacterium]|nr:VOC family protein [Longimicrobiales bacterium]
MNPVPEGYHTITPYLIVHDAKAAIDYYRRAFDATERSRHEDEAGRVLHAEVRIGDSCVMLTEENPDWPEWKSARTRGGTPVHLYVYVEDADAMFQQALAAGGEELLPMEDRDYGDRSGGLTDPFGLVWYISSRIASAATG